MARITRISKSLIKKAFPSHVAANCQTDERTSKFLAEKARTPTIEEETYLQKLSIPGKVDWSGYLGFIRHQGVSNTCIMQATAACLDILKERERPHSPNVSAWWLVYGYWACCTGELPPDPNMPTTVLGQGDVAIKYGCCSEVSYSSRVNLPPPIPTKEQIDEAALIKLGGQEPLFIGPSLSTLKGLLTLGPVWIMLVGSHSMALVGYDDSTAECKFVDSYGDRTDGGFRYWSYSTMNALLPSMWVRPMTNAPTPPDALRYTGSIKLKHKVSRSLVTVGIGVTRHKEQIIWPLLGNATAWDDSEGLTLRFPLPSYAPSHWPPSRPRKGVTPKNEWYVRITEVSPIPSTEVMGCVEEVVLYDRLETVATGGFWLSEGHDIIRGKSVTIKASPTIKPHKPGPPRKYKPLYG